ncbi:Imm32 family immunity protein [Rhodovastum sp. RN2-1]|uniref:Imm32 family immunity protein n=1 Tax=Limobrevibacterium gyesilva TaxID=2991712 RepID=A0AA41YRD2_9PROT|nr:Imm32 family immunity protein [Limobrevibacterium gyesilva]
MLTVELNQGQDRVEIYVDEEGARVLQHLLDVLRRRGGHDHLMTPSWAGTELTEVARGQGTKLMHHLLLVFRGAPQEGS